MCTYLCVLKCGYVHVNAGVHRGQRCPIPGTGSIDSCKSPASPDVDAENWTLVLCRSSACFYLLSRVCSPELWQSCKQQSLSDVLNDTEPHLGRWWAHLRRDRAPCLVPNHLSALSGLGASCRHTVPKVLYPTFLVKSSLTICVLDDGAMFPSHPCLPWHLKIHGLCFIKWPTVSY